MTVDVPLSEIELAELLKALGLAVGPDAGMFLRRLAFERDRLRSAIRKHRDYRGDDRCFADDHELYCVLPEGDTRPARETAVTIENCAKFIECRQQGREYVSPQRRIEELEAVLRAAPLPGTSGYPLLNTEYVRWFDGVRAKALEGIDPCPTRSSGNSAASVAGPAT